MESKSDFTISALKSRKQCEPEEGGGKGWLQQDWAPEEGPFQVRREKATATKKIVRYRSKAIRVPSSATIGMSKDRSRDILHDRQRRCKMARFYLVLKEKQKRIFYQGGEL